MQVELTSPCKVNFLLNILRRRADGFHELETLMHPIGVHDTLLFSRSASGIRLSCNHPELPTDSRNLVFRAAEKFLKAACISDGVTIHLEKQIPLAAGLGGGSANAAVTLLGLNRLFSEVLPKEQLFTLAAQLGSDIPFFLQPHPAVATGRGEHVQPLEFFPALAGYHCILIHPGFGVSTAWAYQNLARYPHAFGTPGRAQELVELLRRASLREAKQHFFNSLEAPVLEKFPILALFQEFLQENGAEVVLMSGSGSTTFALVHGESVASALIERFLSRYGSFCWIASVPLNA